MFSVISVHHSVHGEEVRATITYDALDLTEQDPPWPFPLPRTWDLTVRGSPCPLNMGLYCGEIPPSPAGDIWWLSLWTCSDFFTLGHSQY